MIVSLFIIGYYFYELGVPGGLTEPRMDQAAADQQVTAVERGYNLYEANCAQCHGKQGEGGIGPTLNRQDKLFAHLNPDYLRNVLTVGGRYVCGNPDSLMPVWSNAGNPPGPLNYKQIDYLIAFIRADNDQTFRVMRPEPRRAGRSTRRPARRRRSPAGSTRTTSPAPDATPFPDCYLDEFTTGVRAPGASAGRAPPAPGATVGRIREAAPYNTAQFVEQGPQGPGRRGVLDRVRQPGRGQRAQHRDQGRERGRGVQGRPRHRRATKAPTTCRRSRPARYPFVCSVHANMTGTLTVGS